MQFNLIGRIKALAFWNCDSLSCLYQLFVGTCVCNTRSLVSGKYVCRGSRTLACLVSGRYCSSRLKAEKSFLKGLLTHLHRLMSLNCYLAQIDRLMLRQTVCLMHKVGVTRVWESWNSSLHYHWNHSLGQSCLHHQSLLKYVQAQKVILRLAFSLPVLAFVYGFFVFRISRGKNDCGQLRMIMTFAS